MILQQWILSRCDGKSSVAIRKIEDITQEPCDASRIYRAMRKPLALTGKLAQAVVKASNGECTLAELIDVDLIRKRFHFQNPDFQRTGVMFALERERNRMQLLARKAKRAAALLQKQAERVRALELELAELKEKHSAPQPRAAVARPARRAAARSKPKPKRQARARRAVAA